MTLPSKSQDFSGGSDPTTISAGLARALDFSNEGPNNGSSPYSATGSENPSEVLRRGLSVRSVFSKSSSFAEAMNHAKGRATKEVSEYRVIGIGTCGTVFEIPGTEFAIKKGSDTEAMWKDFLLTNRVHNAIADTREVLQDAFPETTIPKTPRCDEFYLPGQKQYWAANLKQFPMSHREIGAAFKVDRIPSLSKSIREALIAKYFDESDEIQEEAKNDGENKHCLIRVYLGENETERQQSTCYDSLFNFPMRLNMIEDLDMDQFALATEMAIALAVIHWQAQVDGMDTEFVLGSAAVETPRRAYTIEPCISVLPPPEDVNQLDFTNRSVHLWVLDFDKASPITLTTTDVDTKLVPAFLGNDPYYPRPDVDAELWEEFCTAYLKASQLILEGKQKEAPVMALPQRFLDQVAKTIKENEKWSPENNIVFED